MKSIKYSNLIDGVSEYAFANISKKVAEIRRSGKKVIDLGVGDPKNPPPNFVMDGLSKAAQERRLSGYPSYSGDVVFLDAVAAYMKRMYGVKLDPQKEISSTVGSKEAVFHFPLAFINPGDLVICPSPGYPIYKIGTLFAYGEPYFTPLLEENDFLIDFRTIPHEIAKEAKIIWTNYPNSPTGVAASKKWLAELVNWAEKYGIIIAADEGCYHEFYFGDKPHSILEISRKNIITFYSMSKRNNMTGYRVGFVAGDEYIVDGFKKVKTNIDSGTPTFIQDVAADALKDEAHVASMLEEYAKKRKLILDALLDKGFEKPLSDSTFYLWIKDKSGDGVKLAQRFLEHYVVVTPGAAISDPVDGVNPGQAFIRMALVAPIAEIERVADVIRAMEV